MSFDGSEAHFTNKSSCTHLNTEACTHRRFSTQKLLHKEAFTHIRFYTEASTHRSFYTQNLLHREAFTRRHFDTQTLWHTAAFTHNGFYTQKPLHTEPFSHRHFYTQALNWTNQIRKKQGHLNLISCEGLPPKRQNCKLTSDFEDPSSCRATWLPPGTSNSQW